MQMNLTKKDMYKVKRVPHKNDAISLNILLRNISKSLITSKRRTNNFSRFQYQNFKHNRTDKRQFCVMKMTYSNKIDSHRKFLLYYMPQQDKKEVTIKPIVYGSDITEYKANMSDTHFKFIVSPENQLLDQKTLTHIFIEKLEAITGYKFYYQAVEHTNTEHRHTHILINGVDKTGKKIRFEKEIVRSTLRDILRNICTQLGGERTEMEINIAKNKSITAARHTSFDDEILRQSFQNNEGFSITSHDSFIKKRLDFLCSLGLAEKKEENNYHLHNDWDESLKAQGRYNSYLSMRKEFAQGTNFILYTATEGSISGTVKKVLSMNDEDIWNNALIIENAAQKKTWYVPVFLPHKKTLEGKKICMSMKEAQSGKLTPKITIER